MKKLTHQECAEIIAARKIHLETSVKVLAKKYGVSVHTIYAVAYQVYLPKDAYSPAVPLRAQT